MAVGRIHLHLQGGLTSDIGNKPGQPSAPFNARVGNERVEDCRPRRHCFRPNCVASGSHPQLEHGTSTPAASAGGHPVGSTRRSECTMREEGSRPGPWRAVPALLWQGVLSVPRHSRVPLAVHFPVCRVLGTRGHEHLRSRGAFQRKPVHQQPGDVLARRMAPTSGRARTWFLQNSSLPVPAAGHARPSHDVHDDEPVCRRASAVMFGFVRQNCPVMWPGTTDSSSPPMTRVPGSASPPLRRMRGTVASDVPWNATWYLRSTSRSRARGGSFKAARNQPRAGM